MAVGDAYSDAAPLQVGQFESAAPEMDQWLTSSFLEGNGGGQGHETYELAMYFAARHTEMDCWVKRKKRGYFIMTGDEQPYPQVSHKQVKALIGDDLSEDIPVARVVGALRETYEPFFLIPDPARRARCERVWRDLIGDHVVCMESSADTCHVSAGIIGLREGAISDLDQLARRLEAGGATRERIGAVVRALTPLASSLGRDAVPRPHLDGAGLPMGDGASGFKRP
jgi:hypothetical protein